MDRTPLARTARGLIAAAALTVASALTAHAGAAVQPMGSRSYAVPAPSPMGARNYGIQPVKANLHGAPRPEPAGGHTYGIGHGPRPLAGGWH